MPEEEALIVSNGCGTCQEIKDNGACKDNTCIEVSTSEGNKIASQAEVKYVPQKVCKTKDGKWKKCGNTQKIIKKYSKKK